MPKRKKKTIRRKKIFKPKACYFTKTKTEPDYKEVLVLRRFINDRGKILPNKYTGLTAKNQRKVAKEIKRARYMGLLHYTDRHTI